MRALVLLLVSALAYGADCSEVWQQIRANRPASLAKPACNLDFYDRLGRSPLIAALDAKTDVALVRSLLHSGASADFPSRYGNPPLVWAIIAGPAYAAILLESGAAPRTVLDFSGPLFSGFDITRRLEGRVPALLLGAWLQNGSAAVLLAHGVRFDPADSARSIDLMSALPAAELETLLRGGFDVHARNRQGQTLLHELVRLQKRALIPVMLHHGAAGSDKDSRGRTVADLAHALGRQPELDCLAGRLCR